MVNPTKTRKYAHLLLATTTVGVGLVALPAAQAAETPAGTFGVAAATPQAVNPTNVTVTPINANASTFKYTFDLTGVKVNAGDYIDIQTRWGNSEDFNNPSFDGQSDYLLNYTEEVIRANNTGAPEYINGLVANLAGKQIKFNAAAGAATTTVTQLTDQRGQVIGTISKNAYGFRITFTEAAAAQEDLHFSLDAKTEGNFLFYGNKAMTATKPDGMEPGNISNAIVGGASQELYDALPTASPGAVFSAKLNYSIYINQQKKLTAERTVSSHLYIKRARVLWFGNANQVHRASDASPTIGNFSLGYGGAHYASAQDVGNRQTITATINPDTLEYLKFNPDWNKNFGFRVNQSTKLSNGNLVVKSNDEYLAEYGPNWRDIVTGSQSDPTLWDVRLEKFDPATGTVVFSWVPRAEGDNLSLSLPGAALATTKAAKEQKVTGYNFTTTYTHTNAPSQTSGNGSSWYWRAGEAAGLLIPTAKPDTSATEFNQPVSENLVQNDLFPEATLASVSITQQPANGQATINPDGTATYTPNKGFSGTDTVTYEVVDSNGKKSTSTWTITVGKPQPPVAQNDRFKATFNSGQTVEIDPYANDSIPADSAWNYEALTISTEEDENFIYTFSEDKRKMFATVKEGRTGVAPAIEYTAQDIYGQSVTALIQGEISAPTTSVSITTTVNGANEAVVNPDTELEASHLIRNTSDFAYPAGTEVTITTNGESQVLTLPEALEPGQETTLTSKFQVEKRGSTTITSSINVTVPATDATTGEDASVSAGATSTATAKAKVGIIDLFDDNASTIFDNPVEFNIFENDLQQEGFPFLDETFSWVGDGVISEDGKTITFPNGSYTYLGGGKVRWTYLAGTDVVEIPSVQYNVSNALGDSTDPATVNITSKTNPVSTADDTFTIGFNAVAPQVFNILANDTVPTGDSITKIELLDKDGNATQVVEDDNFIYTLKQDGEVSAEVKAGRTGLAPKITYRITDRFGQVSEATIQGTIEAPQTSTTIESTINGEESVTAEPGKPYVIDHKVTNTSKFAYVPAGTLIEVDGEQVTLPAELNPGESYTFTTEATVEKRQEKTVGSRVQVTLNAVDATSGEDASVQATSEDQVTLSALTSNIALADDSNVVLKGGTVSGELFPNDTQNSDYPFLDSTFKWVLPDGSTGKLSEDGKTVTYPNGVLKYIGEGKYEFSYNKDASDFAVPVTQYTVSNLLGDEAPAAKLTINFLSVSLRVDIMGEDGKWYEADDKNKPVEFSEAKNRLHRFTITNDGEAPLTHIVVKDSTGKAIALKLPEALAAGESTVIDQEFFVPEGAYEAGFTVETAEKASDENPVFANVTVPEETPTSPGKDLETKDTNTASNPFERQEGGSVLIAMFAILGAAGVAFRGRIRNMFSK